MRAVPLVLGRRGAEHPGGKDGERRETPGGAPRGPGSVAFALPGPGVLERGRAVTSSVTWARTGELWRGQPDPGRDSLRCPTALFRSPHAQGPGKAETDGCTHSALHTLTFFLEFTLSCALLSFFLLFQMWAVVEPEKGGGGA